MAKNPLDPRTEAARSNGELLMGAVMYNDGIEQPTVSRSDGKALRSGPWMSARKSIALIAHDNRKWDMLEWARYNRGTLGRHELFATGTTGGLLIGELGLEVTRFRSGPLGGDQQVGAGIAEGKIDFVIFFWDPLQPHPHDVDVKALLRIAVVYNIPMACNRASADFMLSSPLMLQEYHRSVADYEEWIHAADRTGESEASSPGATPGPQLAHAL